MGFDQTFAAVVKPMAFRVLFAIAAYYDLDIDQMDVKIAFLYGLIDRLIYVEMPKGTQTNATRNIQYGGYLYPVGQGATRGDLCRISFVRDFSFVSSGVGTQSRTQCV